MIIIRHALFSDFISLYTYSTCVSIRRIFVRSSSKLISWHLTTWIHTSFRFTFTFGFFLYRPFLLSLDL
ncbi:hypothetical protein M413DRAFT_320825 [Hebeloma cylindrosporum]|uniref:Uncharacterized protein n=1 Tax=Hebeloma cylindrosporum TaxID=76867 RepID=A0A0C3BVR2_HEBCY|nr:hypothetical protein M413DRAFT_320825 [Hebeloma cylindrosporum h7]